MCSIHTDSERMQPQYSPHHFTRVNFGDSIPAHAGLWTVLSSERISPWADSLEDIETLLRVMEDNKRLLVGARILSVKLRGTNLKAAIFLQSGSPYSSKLRAFSEQHRSDASLAVWAKRWQDVDA